MEWFRTLGLLLLIGLLSFLLSLILLEISQLIQSLIPQGGDAVAREARNAVIGNTLSALSGILVAPLSGISLTLLYFDLRVRREGLDLLARAEEIKYPLVADPFGDITSEQARRRYFRKKRG